MAIQHKTETINTRIEPAIKHKAEKILNKLGLTNAEAIRIFYKQICLREGIPFEIKLPNKDTLSAMSDVNNRKTHKASSLDDLLES